MTFFEEVSFAKEHSDQWWQNQRTWHLLFLEMFQGAVSLFSAAPFILAIWSSRKLPGFGQQLANIRKRGDGESLLRWPR